MSRGIDKLQKFKNMGSFEEPTTTAENFSETGFPLSPLKLTKQDSIVETEFISINFECDDASRAFNTFQMSNLDKELKDSESVLFMQFQINDYTLQESEANKLRELGEKYSNKAMVFLFELKKSGNFSIYWKSKIVSEFWEIHSNDQQNFEIHKYFYGYIADFLVKSLRRSHSGLCKDFHLHATSNRIEPHILADSRNYNLLLLAAESGNAEVVNDLLSLGIDTKSSDETINAQTLAWSGRHSNVILLLAQANLPYPENIDINECSDELKIFYKETEELHEAVWARNNEKVEAILDKSKRLLYYFNCSNESVAKTALDAKTFDIYEILLAREVFLAPHEHKSGVLEDLTKKNQRTIRDIHYKYSKDLPEKHINVLMANSFVGHDVPDVQSKLNHVYQAYKFLSEDVRTNTILKAVAASKGFRIIFDFNRDAVNVADPTVASNTEGLFYTSGRIYIGAKQLLTESTKLQAIATLIHELCHYAMNLVYDNLAKPYVKNDAISSQIFEIISQRCQQEDVTTKVKLIEIVYSMYPEDRHHAELIVRVPHLIVLHHDQPELLSDINSLVPELFRLYDRKIVVEMEKAIPEIEKKDQKKIEKKILKLKQNLKYTAIFSIFSIILAIAVVVSLLYNPEYKFDELSPENQMRVMDGLISYKGVPVKFNDLFPRSSIAYHNLTSEHISKIFDEDILDLSDPHLHYLSDFIHHEWGNLSENLKDKILSSNFTFQGETVSLQILNEAPHNVLISLTSDQIIAILDGKHLNIGSMNHNETKFYVGRKFVFEGYEKILKDPNAYLNDDDIIHRSDQERLFILSSEGGAGKTTSFKQLALEIKKQFPMRWVSYIDLKKFKNYFDSGDLDIRGIKDLLHKILNLSSVSDFEKEIFDSLFESGQVVLLWNGFDEISPTYNKFVLAVLDTIHKSTRNIQYINTRTSYSKQLKENFKYHPYMLLPFTVVERSEFLTKFFVSHDVNSSKIEDLVKKTMNISSTFEFFTPFMMQMIANIYKTNETFDANNLQEIFKEFIKKKSERWVKSDSAKNAAIALFSQSTNPFKIYQKYALLSELDYYINVKKMGIMQEKISDNLFYEEISRIGILFIKNETDFEFVHKSFAEYFVAQYFFENLYMVSDQPDLYVLEAFSNLKISKTICKFIISFLHSQEARSAKGYSHRTNTLIRKKLKNIFFDNLESNVPEMYEMLFKFFDKEIEILKDLLHVNESETLYTAIFNPIYRSKSFYVDPLEIENLAHTYLLDRGLGTNYAKFMNGVHQNGKVLFGIAYYRFFGIKKLHFHFPSNETNTYPKNYLFNFLEMENLRDDERKEVFVFLISHPEIFFELNIVLKFKSLSYINLWEKYEKLYLSKDELRSVIASAIKGFVRSRNLLHFNKYFDVAQFLLEKIENNFTSGEIYELFRQEMVFSTIIATENVFKMFWTLFAKHTNLNQKRTILLETNHYDKVWVGNTNNRVKSQYLDVRFQLYQLSLLNSIDNGGSFNTIADIYANYFSETEMRDIIVNSNEFLIYMMGYTGLTTCMDFADSIEDYFTGNEILLNTFLTRQIESTDLTIFNYFTNLEFFVSYCTSEFEKKIRTPSP